MATATIEGYERTIAAIFNDEFVFEIPLYQRPYAWTTENAEELVSDIAEYLKDDPDLTKIDPYFLGSIVLIKDLSPESKVVDGQQRLTTLTILFSVLRHLADQEHKAALTQFIYEAGNIYKGTQDRVRLKLRERDQAFFEEHIQNPEIDGISLLAEIDPRLLPTDSQRNICNNALHLREYLGNMPPEERQRLALFIGQRCYMVVVTAPERETAYRVFSVLNKRGLDLSFTDILKADIIGEIERDKQGSYTRIWEAQEELLGREDFEELFAHIRMIYRQTKAQGSTLDELLKYVLPQVQPEEFIDHTLTPFAEAFDTIKHASYEITQNAEEINHLFRFLNQIPNFHWLPPAILYLSINKSDSQRILKFFTYLERLAAHMMIVRAKGNDRVLRYGAVLTYIEAGKKLYSADSPLQLSPLEKEETRSVLNDEIYEQSFARYVLLRLDSFLTGKEAQNRYDMVSIEHVLPRNPAKDSMWVKWFPNETQRTSYANRLANLVLLSRKTNVEAQNYDFEKKKSIYFNNMATPFTITTQVVHEKKWTPQVLEARQKYLLDTLIKEWRLA